MPTRVLATDYDGTLATNGAVDSRTTAALDRWRASGRHLVLVTGREVADMQRVFPAAAALFDWMVAENGAVLFNPRTGGRRLLSPRLPSALIEALKESGMQPLSVGDVVVATTRENADAVMRAIEASGPGVEMIFNKTSLTVLPAGVSKATGLTAALEAMAISPADVAGIGDAENDLALIGLCGLGVAVANAVPELKAEADRVTGHAAGEGVTELIEEILASEPNVTSPR